MRPAYVLFDSWYAVASQLHLLEGLGWKYVARLKSNRYFEGLAVRERWPHRFGRCHWSLAQSQALGLCRQGRATLLCG